MFEILGRLNLVLRDKNAFVVGRVVNEIVQGSVPMPVLRCHRSLDITTDNPSRFVNRCVSARILLGLAVLTLLALCANKIIRPRSIRSAESAMCTAVSYDIWPGPWCSSRIFVSVTASSSFS